MLVQGKWKKVTAERTSKLRDKRVLVGAKGWWTPQRGKTNCVVCVRRRKKTVKAFRRNQKK